MSQRKVPSIPAELLDQLLAGNNRNGFGRKTVITDRCACQWSGGSL